jgi:hypothetical protein
MQLVVNAAYSMSIFGARGVSKAPCSCSERPCVLSAGSSRHLTRSSPPSARPGEALRALSSNIARAPLQPSARSPPTFRALPSNLPRAAFLILRLWVSVRVRASPPRAEEKVLLVNQNKRHIKSHKQCLSKMAPKRVSKKGVPKQQEDANTVSELPAVTLEPSNDAVAQTDVELAVDYSPELTTDCAAEPTADCAAEPTADCVAELTADCVPTKTNKKKRKKRAESEVSSVAPSAVSCTKKTCSRKRALKPSMRTPSSYVLFSMAERKKIVALNPEYKLGEVSKLCGNAWKALTSEERSPWQERAGTLRQKRIEEIEEEKKKNPDQQPKRPPSSYLLFAMEERKKVLQENPNLSIGNVSKKCGEVWKAMGDLEKQVWKDKSNALKAA